MNRRQLISSMVLSPILGACGQPPPTDDCDASVQHLDLPDAGTPPSGAVTPPDWLNVLDYGGMNVAALRAAIAAASARGGGTVYVPAGSLDLAGTEVLVPDAVDLVGCSMIATTFRCGGPGGRIAFGTRSDENHRGGMSGNFSINGGAGATLATNPFYVGHVINRLFQRIRVINAAEYGMLLEEPQNSNFIACESKQCGLANLRCDVTTRTVNFYGCIFSGSDANLVQIVQTKVPLKAGGPQCSKLRFYACLMEVPGANSVSVLVEAGTRLLFDGVAFSGGTVNLALRTAAGQVISGVSVRGCEFQATQAGIEALGLSSTRIIDLSIEGQSVFLGSGPCVRTNDFATVNAVSYAKGGTTFWQSAGATVGAERIVRQLGERQAALTASATNAVDATWGSDEAAVLGNLRTRLSELEDRLLRAGLL